jgi:two-component system cell cycle response regulator DivK
MADILLIDDDPLMREAIAALLRDLGHSVRIAADGAGGLREAVSVIPEFVILEMNMPAMNGYDVAMRLKSRPETAAVPILALSGHASIADYVQAKAAGCDGFLAKPVNAVRLGEKLRFMLMLPRRANIAFA